MLLSLLRPDGVTDLPPIAETHEVKAELLWRRFFPELDADLQDISLNLYEDSFQQFTLSQEVTPDEIADIIRSTGA